MEKLKNLELSSRDKKLLISLLGILLLVMSYLLVFNPQMEKADAKKADNAMLDQKLSDLLALKEKQAFYEDETNKMNREVQEYMREFPADIRAEDGIMLAQNMENNLDMHISNIGLGEKELVANLGGTTQNTEQDTSDETMMEQGNKSTQEAVDEVEGNISGTDSGTDSAAGTSGDASNGNAADASDIGLYRTQNSMAVQFSYLTMKDMVNYINQLTGRVTIDSINAGFDSSTGLLNGNMNINMFSMTGTDAVYGEPETNSRERGTDSLFKSAQ